MSFSHRELNYFPGCSLATTAKENNASLKNFHEKYRFGLCTSSLEPTDLAGAIEKLATDETLYRASVTEGQRALHAEFTESTFRTAFQRFLGVDTDADGAKAPHSAGLSATSG